MEPAYFGQCTYCPNIDENNYPEETELEDQVPVNLRAARKSTGST